MSGDHIRQGLAIINHGQHFDSSLSAIEAIGVYIREENCGLTCIFKGTGQEF